MPRALARLNRVGLNRVIRHVVWWLPGFGLVVHAGRRTGRVYRTPVNLFVDGTRYTIALVYGTESEWARNVLAAGGCDVITRGRRVRLGNPRVVHDESRAAIRPVERQVLRLLRVADFLVLDAVEPGRP
jgi:deazaflavin-dependent oxidoreductase (nitroreductase family)